MQSPDKRSTLSEFISRERNRLVAVFRSRMTNLDEMEIEDVIQDVWLYLFERSELLDSIENLAGYLYRMVKNRLLDRLRHRKYSVSLEAPRSPDSEETWRESLPSPETLPEFLAERELRQSLAVALDGLEPKQRAVWVATELEGHTFRELAEAWREPINTLLSRKRRAALALQAALKHHAPILSGGR